MRDTARKKIKHNKDHLSATEKICKKIIEYGILGLIIFAPLPAASVHEWSILVIQLVVLFMMIAYIIMTKKPQINTYLDKGAKIPGYLFIGLFVFIVFQIIPVPISIIKLISSHSFIFREAFSPEIISQKYMSISLIPANTLKEGLELLSYVLLGFLIIKTVRKKQIKRIYYTLVCMGIFQAFYGMFEISQNNPMILFYRKIYNLDSVTGTFVNRNHFSGYLEMLLPLAIGLILARIDIFSMARMSWREKFLQLSEKGLSINLLFLFGILGMSLAILFSNSRSGAFLLIYTFFLFFGMSALYYRNVRERDRKIMNFLKLVFLGVIILSLYIGVGSTLNRFAMNEILHEGRPAIWANTIQIFQDFPLFGSGLGTFPSIYPGLETMGSPINVYHAHNDYLEYLAELGLLGMSLLIGGILYILVYSFHFWKIRKNREVKGLALGGIVALVCMLFHSITDFNLHIPANMLTFSVILSLTLVLSTYRYRKPDEKGDVSKLKDQVSKIISEKEKLEHD